MFAGSWYPRDPKALDARLGELLSAAPAPVDGELQAIVVPHAALDYSGRVMAAAFRAAEGRAFDRIVLLAEANHPDEARFNGVALPDVEAFGTPLGAVSVDKEAVDRLVTFPGFSMHIAAFDDEYQVEALLPWIRKLFPAVRLVPLVIGRHPVGDLDAVANALRAVLDDHTLLVISSVLSASDARSTPFPEPWNPRDLPAMERRVKEYDAQTLDLVVHRRTQELRDRLHGEGIAACSPAVLYVAVAALGPGDGEVVAYDTSATFEHASHQNIDGIIGYGAAVLRKR